MGIINKIYSEKKTIPSSKMYSDHFTIERTENFHIHLRNLRIELDKNEYKIMSLGFVFGFIKWIFTGMKEKTPGENQFLFLDKVPNSPSLLNGFTTSDEIRVELQQWTDYVHIHYKNIRLEFTVDEAKEFVETVSKSLEGLEEMVYETDRVKRVGFNNRAVPSLVEGDTKNTKFWLNSKDADLLDNPFLTTVIGEKENKYVEEEKRKSGKDGIFGFNIEDLFFSTLYKKTYKNEYGFENNKFIPLENRYLFARLYIENNYKLEEQEIKASPYFKLLSKGFEDCPRDGSMHTIYKNPMAQAKRYLQLINNLKEGQFNLKPSIDSYLSNQGSAIHQYKNGDEFNHEGRNMQNENMMTCYAIDTSILVNDGLHRIAALKALKDSGVLDIDNIDCYLINPNKIHGNSFFSLMKMFLRNMQPKKVFGLGLKYKVKRIFEKKSY